jgi:hypothetical protein
LTEIEKFIERQLELNDTTAKTIQQLVDTLKLLANRLLTLEKEMAK